MALATALSRFSIRKQILIGYLPVILVLGFLAFTSYGNFKTFLQNFNELSVVTEENLTFLAIEKDVVELQRNVLVYSYVGYRGVLKKIEYLQTQLEEKLETVRSMVQQDKEINDRFERMYGHYKDYKEGFREAVNEKDALKELKANKLEPLIRETHLVLEQMMEDLQGTQNFEGAYLASRIERSLLQADTNIRSFEATPDAMYIKNTNQLVLQMQANIETLKNKLTKPENVEKANTFLNLLEQYQSVFTEIITINRVHLHLVNVVLAGKAAEIDALSTELDILVNKRATMLSEGISNNIQSSQKHYVGLSLVAGSIGILSALLIAIGIARPVSAMASTLSQLAKGQSDIPIPGQDRKDEVGEMAKAANEFKVMAELLEQQTIELEEFAYRTSHDLRSPIISSIRLLKMAEQAIHDKNNDTAVLSLSHAQNSLQKLDTLIKDILALTETKNKEEESQNINIDVLVGDVLKSMQHMEGFERLDIQTEFRFKENLCTKKTRFNMILENLISNAIKYQDLKKENPYVKISTQNINNIFILEVKDNGLGVPKNQQDKLFTMFKRFHPKVAFGSGLGLYLIKKSADVLNGEISFEDHGEGSIFRLSIPI